MRKTIAAGASALVSIFGAFLLVAHSALAAWATDWRDLEDRVAELEATTARSGNSKLSFHIYGQVNRALLFWNDGFDSGAYVVDNHTSSSRFGFTGQAGISPGWTAGYRFEFETSFPSSDDVFNGPGGAAGNEPNTLRVRQSYWEVISKDLGRVALGFQSPATDDITIINLGSQMNDSAVHYNNSFRIRLDLSKPPITTGLTWGQIAHNVDSLRGNFIRYDTPILKGFLLSAAAGEDDVWDVALRYQNGSNGFRVAWGLGYMNDQELEYKDLKGSVSLLHEPTGLYVSVAGGTRDAERTVPVEGDRAHFYYAQVGISKQWFATGRTTVYADHGVYKNFNVGEILHIDPDSKKEIPWGTLVDTEVRRWGFGVEQAVDAANLLLYAQAHFYDPTIVGFPCDTVGVNPCGTKNRNNTTKLPAESWQGFVLGARIQF